MSAATLKAATARTIPSTTPSTISTIETMMPAVAKPFLNPAFFDLFFAMMLTMSPAREKRNARIRPTIPRTLPGSSPVGAADVAYEAAGAAYEAAGAAASGTDGTGGATGGCGSG